MDRLAVAEFAERAMDVPFQEKGRSYDGWDCWGLVYVFYKEVAGVELPLYTGDYKSTRRRVELQNLITTEKNDAWKLVDPHDVGDVAVVRMMGRYCHTGVMLADNYMLHVQELVGAVCERIDRPPWRDASYDKVEGIYRYVP